jgi:hypothetical protein
MPARSVRRGAAAASVRRAPSNATAWVISSRISRSTSGAACRRIIPPFDRLSNRLTPITSGDEPSSVSSSLFPAPAGPTSSMIHGPDGACHVSRRPPSVLQPCTGSFPSFNVPYRSGCWFARHAGWPIGGPVPGPPGRSPQDATRPDFIRDCCARGKRSSGSVVRRMWSAAPARPISSQR